MRKSVKLILLIIFSAMLFGGCGGGVSQNSGSGLTHSSVFSDTDNNYTTGKVVRIDVDPVGASSITSGTIRITSTSTGYDSGTQPLSFGSIYFIWDTTGLQPATDYKAAVILVDSTGQSYTDNSLTVTLTPNPPAINKLVSSVDISAPARGLPTTVVRTYLLDSAFNGPLGYGWTHSFLTHLVELSNGQVKVFAPDGTGAFFKPVGGGLYTAPAGDYRTLIKNTDGTFKLTQKNGVAYHYDATGHLTGLEDRNGNISSLAYDAQGRLITVTDPSLQATTFAYDADNRITSITDPFNRTVAYGYDSAGNLATVTDDSGFTTAYAYDSSHNLTTITDPDGRETLFTIDSSDRLATVSGAGGANKVIFQYGVPAADKMTVTDANGGETVLTYDLYSRVTSVVDPSGNTTAMTYDGNMNMMSMTDTNGNKTTYTYDARGKVLTMTDAKGTTAMTYEPVYSMIKSLTDARGATTAFSYDTGGNMTAMTYPDGSQETYGHDSFGNMTVGRDRKGQSTGFQYDTSGRLMKKTFPDGTLDLFTYGAKGNLSSAMDENGTILFYYNAADRLSKVMYPGGEAVSYAYDNSGNRTQTTYPDGTVVTQTYDALGRPIQISSGGQAVAIYSYDALGMISKRTLGNGTQTTFSHDASGRLLDLINTAPGLQTISRFTYTYDNVGNRLSMTTLTGTTSYVYDAIYQLVNVINPDGSTIGYNLDAAGNRVSVTDNGVANSYATNSINQYTTVGGDSYAYDANGNLTSVTSTSGITSYAYDYEDRLVQVNTPTETVAYTYDPFGRRISKTTTAGTTRYIHDGPRVIMEKDGANLVQATYIYGIGIDEVLRMRRGGVNYFYSQDGLGSVIDITDFVGTGVESFTYGPYGRPGNTSTIGNPYMFTGREYEPETGLYYYRARYYSPDIGRFTTTDPIGFVSGKNLYAYVLNNPINFVDPTGFYPYPIRDCTNGCEPKKLHPDWGRLFTWSDFIPWPPAPWNIFWDFIFPRTAGELPGEEFPTPVPPDSAPPQSTPYGPQFPNSPNGGNFPCGSSSGCSAGDPTFIQNSPWAEKNNSKGKSLKSLKGLSAKISVPHENALVRANVPIFGMAYGDDFKEYRVEYGEGADPSEWHEIATLTTPQTSKFTIDDLDDSTDMTIDGNLATWDTGLKNYVYHPTHTKNHPINLKGTYTVRLVVTGMDGKTAEDRVTVDVANVIPNAFGGFAKSTDGMVTIDVPEQSLLDSFRLVLIKPVDNGFDKLPEGRSIVGRIYEAREPGERFTKDAVLKMAFTGEELGDTPPDRLGIYAYDSKKKEWKHLSSARRDGESAVYAKVSELASYYAIISSDAAGEGSAVEASPVVKDGGAAPANGFYLVREGFEDGTGNWSNRDGVVGGEVSSDDISTYDGTRALKITNTNVGGNFAVNVLQTPFDVRDYPIVRFDYRITPDVETNMLVKVSGRWYEVGFTDEAKDLLYKRVNIAHIGDIEDVRADDEWHTARFNLYEMLRTQTGNTIVEEMVMADWNVAGYMKLIFGRNAKGAAYYVDNFSISRDGAAGLRLADGRIVVDDFNQKKTTNAIGGKTERFFDRPEPDIAPLFSNDDASGRGHSLELPYDVTTPGSYTGYLTRLHGLDLRGYQTVTFRVKRDEASEDIQIGLRDNSGRESKVLLSDFLEKTGAAEWSAVTVPLATFTGISLDRIENLSFSLVNTMSTAGKVLLDDIEFHREIRSAMVDDFERKDGKNRLGRDQWTMASGAAAVKGTHTKASPNGIYMLSYGGNIGINKLYASEIKSYAGWSTDLGGIDCSKCETLSFLIRGVEGGENPSVYLSDGSLRWGVETAWYAKVADDWLRVIIPLSDFSENGVDTTHLSELQLVFEGVKMSGTVYFDDIHFGQLAEQIP